MDWMRSASQSPRLIIPDVAARSRVAACPMPIHINHAGTTVFNPGSESMAKYVLMPILRSGNGMHVDKIVCTTNRIRSGVGGTRYFGRIFEDAMILAPEHLQIEIPKTRIKDPVSVGTTDGWKLKPIHSLHVLIEHHIGHHIVLTVPDIHALLKFNREISTHISCDILVLPWRISDRANTPSQIKFMDALTTTIRELEPRVAIVCDGSHSREWKTLQSNLHEAACATELIRTSDTGMLIICAAEAGNEIIFSR